jgi:hypothetical protein
VLTVSLRHTAGRPLKPLHDDLALLRECIVSQGGGLIELTDADRADVVLLFHDDPAAVPLMGALSVLSPDERRRTIVYSSIDHLLPFLPGLYPSLPQWNRIPGTGGAPYLGVLRSDFLDDIPPDHPRRWLFSFAGNLGNAPVRERLMRLDDPRGHVVDTAGHPGNRSGQASDVYQQFRDDYVAHLRDSVFVLCPRGRGPSSVRLYETLRAGRVPVILADDWVPPAAIPWESCSLTIPEADISRLGRLLRERESQAEVMSRNSRRVWDEHFSRRGIVGWMHQELTRILAEYPRFRAAQRRLWWDPRNYRTILRELRQVFRTKKPFNMLNAAMR